MSGRLLLALAASTASPSAEMSLVEGRQDSAVRVAIYEDLQRPDCAAFHRMMDEKFLPRYAETVIDRDFPLVKHAWVRGAAVASFAQQNGLEAVAVLAALEDRHLAEVEKDFQDGAARGVAKTPTVFVNGKPSVVHIPFEEISHAIDHALAGQ